MYFGVSARGGRLERRQLVERLHGFGHGHALLVFLRFKPRDIEGFGLLCSVRMLGAGIDAKIAELDAGQRTARQHPLDRLFHHPLRKLALEDGLRRPLLDAADKAGVMIVDLLVALLAGQHDLVGVDDDNVVTVVDVRRVGRLVLAAQPHGRDGGEPADHEAGGVDQNPFLLDLGGFGRICGHGESFR